MRVLCHWLVELILRYKLSSFTPSRSLSSLLLSLLPFLTLTQLKNLVIICKLKREREREGEKMPFILFITNKQKKKLRGVNGAED